MKWRCDTCGHEQPRHRLTTASEMPLCGQPRPVGLGGVRDGFCDHTGKWLNAGDCGGSFVAIDTEVLGGMI